MLQNIDEGREDHYPSSAVRPGDQRGARIVAMLNKNSGERAAATFVKQQLELNLGAEHVFDLFPVPRQPPAIEEAKAFIAKTQPDVVIVAGGDGTVSLAMDITDAVRKEGHIGINAAPIAVLPMGTGNDLSRSLGFGGGYVKPLADPEKAFKKLLQKTVSGVPKKVDRFDLNITTEAAATATQRAMRVASRDEGDREVRQGVHGSTNPSASSARFSADGNSPQANNQQLPQYPRERSFNEDTVPPAAQPYRKRITNYFSIGFDAEIATNFGQFRDTHPEVCKSRTTNKLWYGCFGCKAMCTSSPFPRGRVSLFIDDKKIPVPSDCRAIIVINVLTYSGGARLWSDSKHHYQPPALDDKLVEVVALYGLWHLVGVEVNTRAAEKLGQGSTVKLYAPANGFMQYDGEPIEQQGPANRDAVITITHAGQSLGMERITNDSEEGEAAVSK